MSQISLFIYSMSILFIPRHTALVSYNYETKRIMFMTKRSDVYRLLSISVNSPNVCLFRLSPNVDPNTQHNGGHTGTPVSLFTDHGDVGEFGERSHSVVGPALVQAGIRRLYVMDRQHVASRPTGTQ